MMGDGAAEGVVIQMRGRVPNEVRQELRKRNLWLKWRVRRDALRDAGYRPKDARLTAIEEYLGPKWATGQFKPFDPDEFADAPVPRSNRPKSKRVPRPSSEGPAAQAERATGARGGSPDLSELTGEFTKIDARRDVSWVANMLDVHGVSHTDAPSPFAWSLLQVANKNDDTKQWFFREFAAKLLPTRSQLELTETTDDGRLCEETIRRAAEFSLLPPGAEGLQPKPAVPPDDAATRVIE